MEKNGSNVENYINPAFTNTSIQSYTDIVLQNSKELCEHWEKKIAQGKEINISMEMTKITLFIISESLFSKRIDFGTDLFENITYAIEWIGNRILRRPFVLPANFPSKSNKKFHKAVATMDQLVFDIIESKRKKNENPADLLSRLMDPDDDKLEGLNEKELRDEVMTLFVAGHETSANVLSWTYYVLATHPEIQEKLYTEISSFGGRPFKFEDMHQMIYTVQVLSETMRMYPPVWHLGRKSVKADEIGGFHVPEGTHVRISPLTIHRNPDYFENPDVFDPDRFEPSIAKNQEQFTYIPFGAGPRLCAGRNFAMMEMVLILAETIRKI